METLEHLAGRLESLEDLRSIVRTMKSLAAVSIRQYEQAVEALRGYYATVETGLQVVLRDSADTETGRHDHAGATGLIVFGSDHGLCGRFNEELVDHVESRLGEIGGGADARWLCVGARPAALLEAGGRTLDDALETAASAARIGETVERILAWLDTWQRDRGVTHVHLFHQRPESTTQHEPAHRVLLPVERGHFPRFDPRHWPGPSRPTYTIDRRTLLAGLLRQYFFVALYRCCAESLAAEHGARLAAMQAADSHIAESIDDVTMAYRRARQEQITTELLDVVSGFEALTGART